MKFLLVILFITSALSLNGQTFTIYNTSNSPLPDNQVNKITIHQDGTVWFATDKGLAALKDNEWKVYIESDGLSSDSVKGFNLLADKLWLATVNGVNSFEVNGNELTSQPEYISTNNSDILSDRLIDIDFDTWMNKWIGCEVGLSVLTDAGTFNYNDATGLGSAPNKVNDVRTIEGYWTHIATDGGGVARLKYNGVDGITAASAILEQWSLLASDTVYTVYVTDDTLRWYGTAAGVSTHFGEVTKDGPVTQGGSWWIYNTFTSDIVNNHVYAITRDGSNNMWFGTRGGVSRYNLTDSTWTGYHESDGLSGNIIFDIKADASYNIWVATDKGVTLIEDPVSSSKNVSVPESFKLKLESYPNPFNPEVTIRLTLGEASNVKLGVYNILGEMVSVISDNYYPAGQYQFKWNALSANSNNYNSGVYIVKASAGNKSVSKKIVLLK